jgi:hypothetical protein
MAERQKRSSSNGNGHSGTKAPQRGEREGGGGRLRAADVIGRATELLRELTGHEPESVSELRRQDGEWHLVLEVLELERVPSSTDILASYEVCLDAEGELIEYRRAGRYVRSQTD